MTVPIIFNGGEPALAQAAATQVQERILDVPVPQQKQDNWCWAAVALGVARWYGNFSETRQCHVAKRVLGSPCCPDGFWDRCDKPQPLKKPLGRHFARTRRDAGGRSFQFVKSEIDQGRPVCVRLHWDTRAGHFVVIVGYRMSGSGRDLYVRDPRERRRRKVPFQQFLTNYDQIGVWDESYQTQR